MQSDTDNADSLDHANEDDITKMLVGFANELLAYEHRMDKAGSQVLFIHDYVAKRRKRFIAVIESEKQKMLSDIIAKQRKFLKQLQDENRNLEADEALRTLIWLEGIKEE